jgi:hypothetical protein
MKKSVECYAYIDKIDDILSSIISHKVEPLLNENKFDEAVKMVKNFYKPSRYVQSNNDDNADGDVIFIGYDLILSEIGRLRQLNK